MFPISDDNPRRQTPIVTWTIIGICVLVYLWQASLGAERGQAAVLEFGMIPARVFGTELSPEFTAAPAWLTVITSMFMHGGWMHLPTCCSCGSSATMSKIPWGMSAISSSMLPAG
jgi:membrane associated rhomboid family serine protease